MQPIGTVLPKLLREAGLEHGLQGWRAVEAWPEVVGPRIAQRARAVGFQSGTLRIEVDGSSWMHELGFLRRPLVQRLNQHLGPGAVRDIHLVHAGGGRPR